MLRKGDGISKQCLCRPDVMKKGSVVLIREGYLHFDGSFIINMLLINNIY